MKIKLDFPVGYDLQRKAQQQRPQQQQQQQQPLNPAHTGLYMFK